MSFLSELFGFDQPSSSSSTMFPGAEYDPISNPIADYDPSAEYNPFSEDNLSYAPTEAGDQMGGGDLEAMLAQLGGKKKKTRSRSRSKKRRSRKSSRKGSRRSSRKTSSGGYRKDGFPSTTNVKVGEIVTNRKTGKKAKLAIRNGRRLYIMLDPETSNQYGDDDHSSTSTFTPQPKNRSSLGKKGMSDDSWKTLMTLRYLQKVKEQKRQLEELKKAGSS